MRISLPQLLAKNSPQVVAKQDAIIPTTSHGTIAAYLAQRTVHLQRRNLKDLGIRMDRTGQRGITCSSPIRIVR